MKSKKVLLGLILAAMVGTAGVATAQVKANYHNNFIEIGPDNLGGRVRSVVLIKNADGENELYAGGVAGGLYKRTTGSWDYIPYVENGKQITLPISYLIQTPNDNNIMIATGEGMAVGENANSAFIVPKGRGLFRFNPSTQAFTAVANTTGADWTYINKMACLYRDNSLYFYVATNGGLFRWKITSESDWATAPEKVFSGAVQDVEIVSNDNMAFFTSGSHLYKIGNVTAQSGCTDISATNVAFGGDALRIEIAAAHSDKTYLYAMVTDKDGLLQGIFLTNDQQNWTALASRTVTPFTTVDNGWHASSLTIDPQNHKRIYIGGSTIWVGEGFVEGSYYQWNKASYSESELNFGNYMGSCYSNAMFCHSGIHQILPYENEVGGVYNYYIATDGGVFDAGFRCQVYTAINKGFNTVQFNDFAIAPDGSIIGGAVDNSCPFIQSRNAHYGGDAAETWYTNENDLDQNRNSIANVLWFNNGGQTASSMFQQILPLKRRGIFVSSNGGDFVFQGGQGVQQVANFGRAFNDYADYTNTQTWTSGEKFLGDGVAAAHKVPHMAIWETTNSNIQGDNVTLTIDTLGYVMRNGARIFFSSKHYFKGDTIGYTLTRCNHDNHTDARGNQIFPSYDTTFVTSDAGRTWAADFQIKAGDVYTMYSRKHFNYPFSYTFTSAANVIVDGEIQSITAHNPIASRMFVNGMNSRGVGVVYMTMTPTDYSKVWDYNTATQGGHTESLMNWFNIYKCDPEYQPGVMAVSNDGDALFIALSDTLGQSMIIRCSNLLAANPSNTQAAQGQLNFEKDYEGMTRITLFDTIKLADHSFFFDRPVTAIAMDPNSDAMVISFGGEGEAANVLYVSNANNPDTRTVTAKEVANGIAVYSACIVTVDPSDAAHQSERGAILVGTDNGVFKAASAAANWAEYGAFAGVPVTAIHQQVKNLEQTSFVTHTGVNAEEYLFAATKFPYALYFGTYGRGIFMDATYVTDTVNDVINDRDYNLLDIPTVENNGQNTLSIYPNPASDFATLDLSVYQAGRATLKVYDLAGKVVMNQDLGLVDAGAHTYRIDLSNFRHGMYLVNITFGKQTATSKLIVR